MKKLLFSLLFLSWSMSAYSQTVVLQPTKITFTASPEHSLVVEGTTILTKYNLVVFDGSTLIQTIDLGKPTPGTGNVITNNFTGAGLPRNRRLTAFLDAVGPAGSTRSVVSNPFVYLGIPGAATNITFSD